MTSEAEQREIEAYNARELWSDAANHLRVAVESIEQAQSALEDVGAQDVANKLDVHVAKLGTVLVVAEAQAKR